MRRCRFDRTNPGTRAKPKCKTSETLFPLSHGFHGVLANGIVSSIVIAFFYGYGSNFNEW